MDVEEFQEFDGEEIFNTSEQFFDGSFLDELMDQQEEENKTKY